MELQVFVQRAAGFVMERKSPEFENKESSLLTPGCENLPFTTSKLSPILTRKNCDNLIFKSKF